MTKGKVLVTGANGLLGANVVRQLRGMGYEVRAMVRKGSDLRSLEGADYEVFEGAITDRDDVFRAVEGCDYVVHSAAATALKAMDLEGFKKINIGATELLVEAARHFNVKRFIFVSTANCFTNGTKENPGDERTGFMPWLRGQGYAYSKFLAQEMVLKEAREHGFQAIVVAPTFLIGPYDAKPSSGTLLLHGYGKRVIFHPPGGKNFIDAEKAARAIGRALTKGKTGEAYLLAGVNMTYRQFFRIVAAQAGRKALFITIPRFVLLGIGRVSDLIGKVFSVRLPLGYVSARLLTLDNYFTGAKAKAELELEDTDLEEAVAKAVEWFRENGYVK